VNGKILVACIGNIFFGDDGFGVEVARALAEAPLPEGVRVVDYGIRGLDLTYALMDPWQAVIFVDVVCRGGLPGTLYMLKPDSTEPDASQCAALDPHALDPVQVLASARQLGEVNAEIYIVGCEPRDMGDELEGRMGLSREVSNAVPEAARMVRELVSTLQTITEPAGTIN
jgi:hydrogenase maturation protease